MSRRTLCVIALRRTCSKQVPICAPFRYCSATANCRYGCLPASVPTSSSGFAKPDRSHRSLQPRHGKAFAKAHEAMSHATLEVADIVRAAGDSFWEEYGSHLAWPHRKVLDAIVRCRTAALGGHRDQCVRCGHQAISYNSCRNRHCPKCQGNARAKWLRRAPQSCCRFPIFTSSSLCRTNSPLSYSATRECSTICSTQPSAAAMLKMARDPRHLGADIGFLGVLHTWGQTIEHHPHVHYIVPAGGLSADRSRWIRGLQRFFLPVEALSSTFRGKFTEALRYLYQIAQLQFHGSLREIASPRAFSRFIDSSFMTGSSMPSRPSVDQTRS